MSTDHHDPVGPRRPTKWPAGALGARLTALLPIGDEPSGLPGQATAASGEPLAQFDLRIAVSEEMRDTGRSLACATAEALSMALVELRVDGCQVLLSEDLAPIYRQVTPSA